MVQTNASRVNVLLLSGGKSTRMMGNDKALVNFKSKPMIEHILEQLPLELIDKIIISCNRNQHLYKRYTDKLIDDYQYPEIEAYSGPLLGVLTALDRYPCNNLLVLPCDTPNITTNTLQKILLSHTKSHATITSCMVENKIHPLHSVFQSQVRNDLYRYLASGKRMVQEFLKLYPFNLVDCNDNSDEFKNFNFLEDLE
ncbi:MAG: molybdenum cofactor guanylyltransferase [Kangiellaceae bacterium]|nr:molybdenum cofactor guanylyltransferase [Kangiellaceae bacterium]